MNLSDTSPLRIGISTSVIQRGRTGVAQYVFSLARALIPHSQQHHITLYVLEEDLPLFQFAAPHLHLHAVPERHRHPVRNILWHHTHLPSLARQHRLDVLHTPSYRRMVWGAPCATVATIHDLAPFHIQAKYDRLRMFYGRNVARSLAHRQSAIIAISQHTADDIAAHFHIPVERQHIIHNGIDHEQYHPGDRDQSQQLIAQRWPQLTAPYFLYLSRLEHPAKNHLRLITAFEQFKAATNAPHHLALGGSDWHGAEAIHQAIARSPYAEQIHALGFIEPGLLPHLYRSAEAMVYPSLFEGFGLPPVEAQACATPVISSTAGSLHEIIHDSALLIDPLDPSSIAKALTQVSTDPTLRHQLITNGLHNAQRFHWDRTASAVLRTYQYAIAHHRHVPSVAPPNLQPHPVAP